MLFYLYGKDGEWYKGRTPNGDIKTTQRIKDAYLFSDDEKNMAFDYLNQGFKLYSLEMTEPRPVMVFKTEPGGMQSYGCGVYRDTETDTTILQFAPGQELRYSPSLGLRAISNGQPIQGVTTNFAVYKKFILANSHVMIDGPFKVTAAALYLSSIMELVGYIPEFQQLLVPARKELKTFCEVADLPITSQNFWCVISRDAGDKLYNQCEQRSSCFVSDGQNICCRVIFASDGIYFRYHNFYCKGEVITNYIAIPKLEVLTSLTDIFTPESYLNFMHLNLWAALFATHGIYVDANGNFAFKHPEDMVPHDPALVTKEDRIFTNASELRNMLNGI